MKSLLNISVLAIISIAIVSCASLRNTASPREQKVAIETTHGNIIIKLYNQTPLHRDNFMKLVKGKFYDGVLFHRVIADFMIQTGDPDSRNTLSTSKSGSGTADYTIQAEIKTPTLYHKRGAVAAARTGDNVNPTKASSGSQFYIVKGKTFSKTDLDKMAADKIARSGNRTNPENDSVYLFSDRARSDYQTIGGTPHLDGNYTVFGEVIKGLEVIDNISSVKTNDNDRPIEDVRIIKIKLVR